VLKLGDKSFVAKIQLTKVNIWREACGWLCETFSVSIQGNDLELEKTHGKSFFSGKLKLAY
jgi:hypothetical protein